MNSTQESQEAYAGGSGPTSPMVREAEANTRMINALVVGTRQVMSPKNDRLSFASSFTSRGLAILCTFACSRHSR